MRGSGSSFRFRFRIAVSLNRFLVVAHLRINTSKVETNAIIFKWLFSSSARSIVTSISKTPKQQNSKRKPPLVSAKPRPRLDRISRSCEPISESLTDHSDDCCQEILVITAPRQHHAIRPTINVRSNLSNIPINNFPDSSNPEFNDQLYSDCFISKCKSNRN